MSNLLVLHVWAQCRQPQCLPQAGKQPGQPSLHQAGHTGPQVDPGLYQHCKQAKYKGGPGSCERQKLPL
ncbi:hypothetical protein DPMN_011668 [Dreissena polymorpha]|uniref:Uncharacterized protein n=1 Tax=Dreissena polymorpha TaxID=45954 RepID=A0A9D4N4J3_DREPO|nr:hypothetical protein DPMN_011668 [Dreissena polymorpha]